MKEPTPPTSDVALPPQNLDAEMSVLGACLLNSNVLADVTEIIRPDHFYLLNHQLIYKVIEDLFADGGPVDPITVGAALADRGWLERAQGLGYLHVLVGSCPVVLNAKHYAVIVRDAYYLRSLIKAGQRIAEMGQQREADPAALMDQAEQMVFQISDRRSGQDFRPAHDLLRETFQEMQLAAQHDDNLPGCRTGFRELDRIVQSFRPANLIILAARPSMGKTALAHNIGVNVATKQKKPVAIFSLEMSSGEVMKRIMCAEARVDGWRLQQANLDHDQWARVTKVCGELEDIPVFVDDSSMLNLLEVRAKSRRLKAKNPNLGLIIIDYLQLMMGDTSAENRQQEVTRISRGLKCLARDLQVPVLALSQLNRLVERREGNRPQLSDLRDSGSLEQDADVVMFIYRDELYNPEGPDQGIAEITVSKQRNGPVGKCRLAFSSDYTSFADLADRLEER